MRPLAVVCSKCGAGFLQKCRDRGLDRDDPHRIRVKACDELNDSIAASVLGQSTLR